MLLKNVVAGAAMIPSFRTADRQTCRRVVIVGVLFCLAFVVISFSLRPQSEEVHVLLKADRLKRTGGEARPAN
jgi:hypothetical protein